MREMIQEKTRKRTFKFDGRNPRREHSNLRGGKKTFRKRSNKEKKNQKKKNRKLLGILRAKNRARERE